MDNSVDIQITDIGALPHTVSEVAAWHHAEWIKGLPENVYQEREGQSQMGQDAQEREYSLRAHIEPSVIPSTFIAHQNGRPLGSVSIVNYQFSREHKPSQWLTNLFVVEEFRNQGLASRLIDCALAYAREHNLGCLYLYTRDLDRFYMKRGWEFSHEGVVQGHKVSVLKRFSSR